MAQYEHRPIWLIYKSQMKTMFPEVISNFRFLTPHLFHRFTLVFRFMQFHFGLFCICDFIPQYGKHLHGIPFTQFTVSIGCKMQVIWFACTPTRRNYK